MKIPKAHSTVVAYLALIVAVSGSAYAAATIKSSHIVDNTIKSRDVRDDTLKGGGLKGIDIIEDTLGIVPSATNADHATTAGTADNATNASHATTAGSADSASIADNADNADLLDGMNSTAFLPANGKAADSDLLDGLSSSAFLQTNQKAADSDLLDGMDSTAFLPANGKAADSDALDGLNSSQFSLLTAHNAQFTDFCDTPNVWNECGTVTVNVPAGKTFHVSAWTTATMKGNGTAQDALFCTLRRLSTETDPGCITPFGVQSKITIPATGFQSAASSGETTITEGSWIFSFGFNPPAQVGFDDFGRTITKVLVRDAATGDPVSASAVSVSGAQKRDK